MYNHIIKKYPGEMGWYYITLQKINKRFKTIIQTLRSIPRHNQTFQFSMTLTLTGTLKPNSNYKQGLSNNTIRIPNSDHKQGLLPNTIRIPNSNHK